MPSEPAPSSSAARLQRISDWLFQTALPFWAERGMDPVHGGFYERLNLDGTPDIDCARRVRVQARQIYVFAHAARLGWRGPAEQIVEAGFEFVTHRAWCDDGGWAHMLSPQGAIADPTRDAYDHAFVLLAMAWAYRALGRHDPITWAERTLEFLDAEISDERHGGYLEGLPPKTPRRQNPHMHLLEAMLALLEATGEDAYADRAHDLVDLFRRRFFDAKSGVLQEYFEADWSPVQGETGAIVEPGHHYEWVWLLWRYEQATGELMGDYMERLYDFAERAAVGPYGFALDAVTRDGAPAKATRRLWPQTEALKASLAMTASGRRDASARIDSLIDGIFDIYIRDDPPGAWTDVIDDVSGRPAVDHIPASIPYHIMSAFSETLRVLER
ncbi:MAG: AGE family epimerase/isomerase [Pseudomonadota bacterium]